MKPSKLIFTKKLYLLLTGIVVLASACKKDKQNQRSLFGNWNETQQMQNYARTLNFGIDSTFSMSLYSTGITASTIVLSGKYRIKGDSLLVTITQRSTKTGNEPAVIEPANDKLYDKATYTVSDNLLLLKYTTYPADGPVATQANFSKLSSGSN